MTRPVTDIERVAELISAGVSQAEAARRTGIPRGTLRGWIKVGLDEAIDHWRERSVRLAPQPCVERPCSSREVSSRAAYAYLLGMYLGDGSISAVGRDNFKLRITLDAKYPEIVAECERAMASVLPSRVGRIDRFTWFELWSCSKHWPCVFPQHGAGRKHRRIIALQAWQERIALDQHPELLLRGLIHSDGCRVLNWVNGTAYPRYHFSNRSDDILGIFSEACRRLGIACRPNNRWQLSVARRMSVSKLDEFIGPKR
jgi:hypothetical protein